MSPAEQARYLQLPHPYPRVAALAAADHRRHRTPAGEPVTTDPRTYDKVEAIERWMATHIHYTTDIPPLPAGPTPSTSFLFGTRRGYCEQISTATAVMLRILGIPAREAVGYVPGSYNPITDLYDVQAKDAHAWVQVWFPGYGWQNFDPTADVPLANPSPGSVMARSPATTLGRVPWIPLGVVPSWPPWWSAPASPAPPPGHVGPPGGGRPRAAGCARVGIDRRSDETLSAYGRRLAGPAEPARRRTAGRVTRLVERAPTAASSLRRPDHRGPGLHPALPLRPAAGRGGPTRSEHDPQAGGQCLVERGAGGQQRPVAHELARPAERQHRGQPVPAR